MENIIVIEEKVILPETPLCEQTVTIPCIKGDKGDPLTYDDLTPEQIEELQRPAIEAAETANEAAKKADTATEKANTAAQSAITATTNANNATSEAITAASLANEATDNANSAALDATNAANRANEAITSIGTLETQIENKESKREVAETTHEEAETQRAEAETSRRQKFSQMETTVNSLVEETTEAKNDATKAATNANAAADKANQAAESVDGKYFQDNIFIPFYKCSFTNGHLDTEFAIPINGDLEDLFVISFYNIASSWIKRVKKGNTIWEIKQNIYIGREYRHTINNDVLFYEGYAFVRGRITGLAKIDLNDGSLEFNKEVITEYENISLYNNYIVATGEKKNFNYRTDQFFCI